MGARSPYSEKPPLIRHYVDVLLPMLPSFAFSPALFFSPPFPTFSLLLRHFPSWCSLPFFLLLLLSYCPPSPLFHCRGPRVLVLWMLAFGPQLFLRIWICHIPIA